MIRRTAGLSEFWYCPHCGMDNPFNGYVLFDPVSGERSGDICNHCGAAVFGFEIVEEEDGIVEASKRAQSHNYTGQGWEGENYERGLGTKEIAAKVREYVKSKYPAYKFSVRYKSFSGGSGINIDLMSGPTQPFADDKGYGQLNQYYLDSSGLQQPALDIMKDVYAFVSSFRYDDSNSQIDYFDTNFYLELGVGNWDKPYVKTAQYGQCKTCGGASISLNEDGECASCAAGEESESNQVGTTGSLREPTASFIYSDYDIAIHVGHTSSRLTLTDMTTGRVAATASLPTTSVEAAILMARDYIDEQGHRLAQSDDVPQSWKDRWEREREDIENADKPAYDDEETYRKSKDARKTAQVGFSAPDVEAVVSAEEATDIAIEWQSWMSAAQNLSMGEFADWEDYFEALAEKFPEVREEFIENAIIGGDVTASRKRAQSAPGVGTYVAVMGGTDTAYGKVVGGAPEGWSAESVTVDFEFPFVYEDAVVSPQDITAIFTSRQQMVDAYESANLPAAWDKNNTDVHEGDMVKVHGGSPQRVTSIIDGTHVTVEGGYAALHSGEFEKVARKTANDLKDYHPSRRGVDTEYRLEFDYKGKGQGNGYSFVVDAQGNLTNPGAAKANYDYCLAHPEEFDNPGGTLRTFEFDFREDAWGKCPIDGTEVILTDGLENFCDHGHCYNMSGDRVMSRSEWEAAGGEGIAGERWDEDY